MNDFIEIYIDEYGADILKKYNGNMNRCLLTSLTSVAEEMTNKDIKILCLNDYIPWLGNDYNIPLHINGIYCERKKVKKFLKNYKKVLLIARLGDIWSSSLYVFISNLCQELKIKCDAIISLPFAFEGEYHNVNTVTALNMGTCNNLLAINSENLKQIIPLETPLMQAFDYLNQIFIKYIEKYEKDIINNNEINPIEYYRYLRNEINILKEAIN